MNQKKSDLFLSYHWINKNQVKQLEDELTSTGLRVCKEDKEYNTNDNNLNPQAADVIKNSQLFVCCLSNDYCNSNNCFFELDYANIINKPMIILKLESLKTKEISKVFNILNK